MALVGDDCYFFYNSACNKGPGCPYRHVEEAKASDVTCPDWTMGSCPKVSCPLRHAETPKNRQAVPCYYETQASGCTKAYCPFLHKFPKAGAPPPVPESIGQPIVTANQPVGPPQGWPPHTRPPAVRGLPPHAPPIRAWAPPQHMQGPPPDIRGPPPHVFPGQIPVPVSHPPRFHHPPPGPFPNVRLVEPVIISLNSEESDQDSVIGSPMKGRTIVPPQQNLNPSRVDNPLDYFLTT